MSAASSVQNPAAAHVPVYQQPSLQRHLFILVLLAAMGAFAMAWGLSPVFDARAGGPGQGVYEVPTPTLVPGTGAIVGLAWHDMNNNGLLEAGEPPLAGMLLSLAKPNGTVVATALTGNDGRYRLGDLDPGLYQLTATAPPGYQLTTTGVLGVYVSAGNMLAIDFGAQFIPTPTPTATPVPRLDTDSATFLWCGSVIRGSTRDAANNVSSYACRPHWRENGPEVIYRLELNRTQLFTAELRDATADLDLFLLRTAFPDSCVAAGDTYLSLQISPGLYYLVIDGYDNAVGDFTLKVECPLGVQATATPTLTPSPTPTVTPTFTPGPTATPTATPIPRRFYLPVIIRQPVSVVGPPSVVVFQQGLQGYGGAADTTLSAWQPDTALGESPRLSLRYNQQTAETTHMAPLLRFDLSLLPANVQVISATLTLSVVELERPEDIRGEVYGLLVPWRSETATWRQRDTGLAWNRPGAQGAGSDHMAWRSDGQLINSGSRWVTFDVSTLVRGWLAQPLSNFGLVILAQPGESGSNLQVDFASSEYGEVNLRPKLTVAYLVPLAASTGR